MAVFNYCTLFDSLYLSRALTMYESLKRDCPNFHLYIFAFDPQSEEILKALSLSNVTVISLHEFEDDRLLSVKQSRTKAEYCWTCTPATILYCIKQFNLDHCTYIDADLYFFSNPNLLVEEMGGQSILITEHRYTKKYDRSSDSGIYCVQFITFKNTVDGMIALEWWRERCLEWCYSRYEDGKFGDQKYLDDWTVRFKGVHVLAHLGGGVAPWNVQQYEVHKNGDTVQIEATGEIVNLIFYHFHYVKFYENDLVDLGSFELNNQVKEIIYRPYLQEIAKTETKLKELFSFDRRTQQYLYVNRFLTVLHKLYRMARGAYNVKNLLDFRNGEIN